MLLKIDFRETELFTACAKLLALPEYAKYHVKIVACAIPLGDIILCEENAAQTEKIIIERKTLDDLAASIRDGRYAEQSFRLNECSSHNHNIYYLIEGDFKNYKSTYFSKNKIDKKCLLSAMTSIHYYKGFSVMRTLNVVETAEWLIQMADKIQREQLKNHAVAYYANTTIKPFAATPLGVEPFAATLATGECPLTNNDAPATSLPKDYVNVVVNKRIKKDNITAQNIGEIMLMQIPEVSANAAIAIMKKYGSLCNLMNALKETTILNSPLNAININEAYDSKKPRKLNKTTILNVYKYLINNTEL
jgi:ERCC4-type nuclease